MWHKPLTIALAGFALSACGKSAEGGSVTDSSPPPTENSTITPVGHNSAKPIGMLPRANLSKNVDAIQTRLSAFLKTNATQVDFSDDTKPISRSVSRQSPGVPMEVVDISLNAGLYLVINNLQPVSKLNMEKLTGFTCENDTVYKGYFAASPSLFSVVSGEMGYSTVMAEPYGMLACDMGHEFKVRALPITHKIFETDEIKNAVMNELSQENLGN